ncbi:MAG: fatty acid--CoA ligase [Siphonobacter aquaeclarae]|nr:fatty acid--CoA ligase [Siphonobacter aquaeclarae]
MNIRKLPKASGAYSFPLLIKHILQYSDVLEPDRQIVYRDQVSYSYAELKKRVARLANVLSSLGLSGGETVAVCDYDSHRYLEGFFGIPMTGNVLHTINWRLSPAQILYTINHAEDVVIITHVDFLPLLTQLAPQFTSVKKIIVASEGQSIPETPLTIAGEYEELLAAASDQFHFPDFDEEAVATTFYTTGTTGSPKGVYFTHRQLVLHTLAVALSFMSVDKACSFNNSAVYMPLTPFFHVHAWGFPYVATLLGIKQVLVGRFEPEMTLKLFVTHKPTISHCVPTILQMFVGHPAAKHVDLSHWKVIIGGAALPSALCKAALERGVDIVAGYGMSETCPFLTTAYLGPEDRAVEDLSEQIRMRIRTGSPTVFVDLRVVDEDMRDVPADDETMGEIVVRSPWLTQGYYREPELSEQLWRGGYLHTGDVATMNERGSIKIADRIKDVIKTGGEWVSSIDLENFIGTHPGVAEVAVVGIPDAKWGERPFALVVLKQGQEVAAEDIRAHLQPLVDRGEISKWAVPDSIQFAEAIPKTSVGKIDKKTIRGRLTLS